MSGDAPQQPQDPLDLREVFARPWSGNATIWRPWWLRWLPIASRLHFRTETTDRDLAETTGLTVHDTTTFPNGTVWRRTMTAKLVAPGRWTIRAKDMPGGAEQTVSADGFQFSPYTIVAPTVGPIRLPLRCLDSAVLLDPGTMSDTIEMRFLGVHVATMVMRLERE